MHCPWFSNGCSSMQGICAWLNGEAHMKCNGIQGIYVWLTWGSICLLYICIVLHLAVGVVACKTSILKWLGAHLSSICMHCPRYSSGCSSMQGISAQLTGEDLCWIALCYANIFGVAVFNASVLDWLGFHLPSIYMKYSRSSSGCSIMLGICVRLTGVPSAFYIYALS